MQETWVLCLDWEDPLEKGMAIHPSIKVKGKTKLKIFVEMPQWDSVWAVWRSNCPALGFREASQRGGVVCLEGWIASKTSTSEEEEICVPAWGHILLRVGWAVNGKVARQWLLLDLFRAGLPRLWRAQGGHWYTTKTHWVIMYLCSKLKPTLR